MMVRKHVIDGIRTALSLAVPEVKHVDLWNHNVEFIEQEEAWERPAVFVEFGPIVWRYTKEWSHYRSESATISLHIVTDWHEGTDNAEAWELSDAIVEAVRGLDGSDFTGLELKETHTNHNHEELLESIEVFGIRMLR